MFWTSTHPNCLSPQEKINSSCSRWRCPSLISVEYYPHLHRFSPLHMSQMCFRSPRARIERCSSCFANVWCRLHHDLRYGVRGGDQTDSTWTSMNVGAANWIRLDIVRPQNPRPRLPDPKSQETVETRKLCALSSLDCMMRILHVRHPDHIGRMWMPIGVLRVPCHPHPVMRRGRMVMWIQLGSCHFHHVWWRMAVGVLRVLCHGDQIVRNWMTVRVLRVSCHLHNIVVLVMRFLGCNGWC